MENFEWADEHASIKLLFNSLVMHNEHKFIFESHPFTSRSSTMHCVVLKLMREINKQNEIIVGSSLSSTKVYLVHEFIAVTASRVYETSIHHVISSACESSRIYMSCQYL